MDLEGTRTTVGYNPEFQANTHVRIADRKHLEEFKRSWRYHHPLAEEQLNYAGRAALVESVGMYHGGDQLYILSGIPGIWHESCLFADASLEE